jgi:lipoprotein-anchoring transpeptidase ErfK/SrfK
MMRIVTAALLAGLAGLWLPAAGAQAQTAPSGVRTAQASQPSEASAQRRRAVRRVPIYPRDEGRPEVYPHYYPGADAVRECTATYVQEFRPSGTVITPRMNCYWRRG